MGSSLTEFIMNMSHDIRTPLSGMIYMAQAMEDVANTEEIREYVRLLCVAAERLLDLLNSVLEIIAAEHTSEEEIKKETLDLRKLIEGLEALILPSIKAKGLKLNIDLDPAIPPYLESDRIKLEQILLNLLANAIKFTDKGIITLKLKLLSQDENKA